MIHLYTGDGKGKTTAALGLALRFLGAGKKVFLIQFLKDGKSSEIKAIRRLAGESFQIKAFGRKRLVDKNNLTKKDYRLAEQGFLFAQEIIQNKKHDLVILDEINPANYFGLLKTEKVLELVQSAPKQFELVLTGRYPDKKIIQAADLVSRINQVKHYYQKGIKARKGVEF